jgi:hypothetical protein
MMGLDVTRLNLALLCEPVGEKQAARARECA